MLEQWKRWIPEENIPTVIYNKKLVDGCEGILLTFGDEDDTKIITVKFDGNVISYRNTDEGSLLKKVNFLDEKYGLDFYSGWPLFKAKNTDYIHWLIEESSGIYEVEEISHYIFMTPHDVIEVLSTDAPIVKVEHI